MNDPYTLLHDCTLARGCLNKIKILRGEQLLHLYTGHTDDVLCLTVIANGSLVSGSKDRTIRVWKDTECKHVLTGHSGWVTALVALNNFIYSGSTDTTIRLWKDSKCIYSLVGHKDTLACFVFLKDNTLVSCSVDNVIKLWKNNICINTIKSNHKSEIVDTFVLRDGSSYCTVDKDGNQKNWMMNVQI